MTLHRSLENPPGSRSQSAHPSRGVPITCTPPRCSQPTCSARNRPSKCLHVKHPAVRACVATGYGLRVRGSMAETIHLPSAILGNLWTAQCRRATLSAWSRSARTAEKSSSRYPNLESCRCACCSANAGTPRLSQYDRCSTRQPAVALSLGCRATHRRASCHPPWLTLPECAAHPGRSYHMDTSTLAHDVACELLAAVIRAAKAAERAR